MEAGENPFQPYLDALRKELEHQDPIFIIGIIFSLAVVVISFGKLTTVTTHPQEQSECKSVFELSLAWLQPAGFLCCEIFLLSFIKTKKAC